MQTRRLLLASLAIATASASFGSVSAQTYPSRPITMVVPFAPGGPTDTIGRIVAERLQASFSQAVIIENVTGAGGSIGVGRVARAPPDGYTVSIGHWGTHVVNGAIYALQHDLLKNFEPISLIASNPWLIVAKNAMPANDLKGFIAWLKANPDKASAGTGGVGTPSHVFGVFFRTPLALAFSLCPIAAPPRPCRIWCPGKLT